MARAREDAVAEARARSARPGLRSARSCRPGSRRARGSTPRRRTCPRARARDPTGRTGRTGRTVGPGSARRRPRFRGGDLLERAAEVDGRRTPCAVRGPRDGSVERPVDLEHARAVAEPLGVPADARATAAGPAIASSWRGVTSRSTARAGRQLLERRHPMAGDDLAARGPQLCRPARRRRRSAPPRTIGQPTACA